MYCCFMLYHIINYPTYWLCFLSNYLYIKQILKEVVLLICWSQVTKGSSIILLIQQTLNSIIILLFIKKTTFLPFLTFSFQCDNVLYHFLIYCEITPKELHSKGVTLMFSIPSGNDNTIYQILLDFGWIWWIQQKF